MRFSKSIKIGSHSKINVSKSGVSFTVGVRGLSVNVGPKGVYLNTSIPGTGLSDRKKIMDNPLSGKKSGGTKSKSGRGGVAKPTPRQGNGGERGRQAQNAARRSEQSGRSQGGGSSAAGTEQAIPAKLLIRKNDDGQLEFYDGDQKITDEAMIRKIKASHRYQAQKDSIDAAFRSNMAQKVQNYNEQNAKLIDIGDLAPNVKSAGDAGAVTSDDPTYIKEGTESWLNNVAVPFEFSAQYSYDEVTNTMWLDLDLPEIEDIPQEEASQLDSGKMKVKNKTQAELRQDYAKCVFGFAITFAAGLLNVSTALERVVISAYTQRRDADGNLNDDFIYSIVFPRDKMTGRDLAAEEPYEVCMEMQNRVNMSKTYVFKTIRPFEAEDLD